MNERRLEAVRQPADGPRADHTAERMILGGSMLDADAFGRAECIVEAADFDHPRNALVFESIAALAAESKPIDQVTVAAELGRRGRLEAAGGIAYLNELADACGSASNIEAHAQIVADHAFMRRLGDVGAQLVAKSRDRKATPEGAVEFASSKVFEVTERRTNSEPSEIVVALDASVSDYGVRQAANRMPGASTGLRELDEMISGGGIMRGRSYLFCGQPGAGKTGLVTGILQSVAHAGEYALFFVLEMSKSEMAGRLICREGRFDTRKWDSCTLSPEDFQRVDAVAGRISSRIFIDDSASTTVMDIRAKTRRLQRKLKAQGKEVRVVAVDYMQLVSVPNISEENREAQISFVSRGLKSIAKELNVAMIAISSLNQNAAKRQDKRPELGDLKGSGAVAFDADLVAAVYRDELVNRKTDDRGWAEVIILKQRNGPTGTVRLKFEAHCVRFESAQEELQYDTRSPAYDPYVGGR